MTSSGTLPGRADGRVGQAGATSAHEFDGPSGVAIRRASSGDLEALVALDAACFESEAWAPDGWRAELESPSGLVLVAESRQVVAGDGCERYADVVAAASFQMAGETAELHTVGTLNEWRGLGIATLLLARGCDWARRRGASEMLLEVRVGNGALALYIDLGFEALYERTNYYGPGLDALVMRRELRAGQGES